jgi:hypothetical protein
LIFSCYQSLFRLHFSSCYIFCLRFNYTQVV